MVNIRSFALMYIDTHTHLYSEEFDADREESIKRAKDLGIQYFLLPAIDSEYVSSMQNLHKQHPESIFMMAGLHPAYVKPDTYKQELQVVEEQLKNHRQKYIAIGEIGIDLHWDKTTLEIQKEAFRTQIQWAKEYELPIVIHCRKGFDPLFEVLKSEASQSLKGVFHCFSGSLDQANHALRLGLKLGIGGVVTFKNAKLGEVVQQLPLDSFVLETDSPYLAPAPYRGKRNESSYIPHIAEKIAELHNCSVQLVADVTTEVAKQIFKLPI